jgi:hypothetical protein
MKFPRFFFVKHWGKYGRRSFISMPSFDKVQITHDGAMGWLMKRGQDVKVIFQIKRVILDRIGKGDGSYFRS